MRWTSDTPVILYGASHSGLRIYNKLVENCCNIIAFIDKRADLLVRVMGLPVHTIDSHLLTKKIKRESIVIVCVNNVFDHEKIVSDLLQHGFHHVVFYPVDMSVYEYISEEKRKCIADVYNHINDDDLRLPIDIISSEGLFSFKLKECAIISEENGYMTVNVPSIFTFTRRDDTVKWGDSPMLTLFPHLELFEWFSGNADANPRYYIELYCHEAASRTGVKTSPEWEHYIFDSRKMIYERMKISDELSSVFLTQNAVRGTWNDKGYFNMESGKHRAAYLIHRRRVMIPLVMSENDYNMFLNKPLAMKLYNYCKENSVAELPYPVYNPLFYSMPYRSGNVYYELLLKLLHWLAMSVYEDSRKISLRGLTVLDDTDGRFTSLMLSFCVLDCNIETVYEINEFDKIVVDLYHISKPPVYIETRKEHYNVVFTEYDTNTVLTGADYFVVILDYSDINIEAVSEQLDSFRVLHTSQEKLITVGKRKVI